MKKVIRIGKVKDGNVFCKIRFEDGNLSITGVIGPMKNGDARGNCGQIKDFNKEYDHIEFASEWNQETLEKFLDIWDKWHLNDLQAGCEHQRADKWVDARINPKELPNSHANRDERGILAIWVTPKEHKDGLLTKPCPVCGYKYGSAWLKMEVPQDVIDWLFNLPETDVTPAWI